MKLSMKLLKRYWLIAGFASLLLLSVRAQAGSYVSTVTNAAVKVLGPSAVRGGVAYATNTAYTAGSVVWLANRAFLCVGAGTSTNAVVVALPSAGDDFVDGTVTWRPCLSKARRGLVIVNGSTNAWMFVSDTGVANKGARFNPDGGSFAVTGDDCPSGAVWVNCSSATPVASIYIAEW